MALCNNGVVRPSDIGSCGWLEYACAQRTRATQIHKPPPIGRALPVESNSAYKLWLYRSLPCLAPPYSFKTRFTAILPKDSASTFLAQLAGCDHKLSRALLQEFHFTDLPDSFSISEQLLPD